MKSYFLYKLTFPNQKLYFGVTDNIPRRWKNHRCSPNSKGRSSIVNALRKYGPQNIKFEIIVIGNEDYILELEKAAIKKFKTQNRFYGYNVDAGGKPAPMRQESCRKKLRLYYQKPENIAPLIARNKARKGEKRTLEQCLKLRGRKPWNLGKSPSQETRNKISNSLKGKKFDEARKEKLRGRVISEDTRKKLSQAQRHPCKEETKDKIRKAHLGKKHPPEFGEKQSQLKKEWWAKKKTAQNIIPFPRCGHDVEQARLTGILITQ